MNAYMYIYRARAALSEMADPKRNRPTSVRERFSRIALPLSILGTVYPMVLCYFRHVVDEGVHVTAVSAMTDAGDGVIAVSYTHLTLPTKRIV